MRKFFKGNEILSDIVLSDKIDSKFAYFLHLYDREFLEIE